MEYNFVLNIKPLSYYATIKRSKYGMYFTKKGKEFRDEIHKQMKVKMNDLECEMFDCSVEVSFKFYFDNKRKNDLSNVLKVIEDCLNLVLFKDDSQLCKICCEKFYDKENPRIEIMIKKLILPTH